MADLSLVIPAYVTNHNVAEWVPKILDGYRASGSDVELIVVDNGSHFSQDVLASAGDLNIRVDRNLGYSGGVNTGLVHAKAPVVGVGSIDILMPDNWGDKFLEHPGLVCSPLETGKREIRHQPVRGRCWPAMFTFPREAVDTVGLFDTDTFSAYADRDYGIRLAQAGFGFTRVDVPVEHVASNHAHRHLHRYQEGYQQRFAGEIRAMQRVYGTQHWSEWMARNRPDDWQF